MLSVSLNKTVCFLPTEIFSAGVKYLDHNVMCQQQYDYKQSEKRRCNSSFKNIMAQCIDLYNRQSIT